MLQHKRPHSFYAYNIGHNSGYAFTVLSTTSEWSTTLLHRKRMDPYETCGSEKNVPALSHRLTLLVNEPIQTTMLPKSATSKSFYTAMSEK